MKSAIKLTTVSSDSPICETATYFQYLLKLLPLVAYKFLVVFIISVTEVALILVLPAAFSVVFITNSVLITSVDVAWVVEFVKMAGISVATRYIAVKASLKPKFQIHNNTLN